MKTKFLFFLITAFISCQSQDSLFNASVIGTKTRNQKTEKGLQVGKNGSDDTLQVSGKAIFKKTQVAIGGGIDSSSALNIVSTSKGVLLPRVTTSQMLGISSPSQALLVYNLDSSKFYYYAGSTWIQISPTGAIDSIDVDNRILFSKNRVISTSNDLRVGDSAIQFFNRSFDVKYISPISGIPYYITIGDTLPTLDGIKIVHVSLSGGDPLGVHAMFTCEQNIEFNDTAITGVWGIIDNSGNTNWNVTWKADTTTGQYMRLNVTDGYTGDKTIYRYTPYGIEFNERQTGNPWFFPAVEGAPNTVATMNATSDTLVWKLPFGAPLDSVSFHSTTPTAGTGYFCTNCKGKTKSYLGCLKIYEGAAWREGL